jgi:hypothetical protein
MCSIRPMKAPDYGNYRHVNAAARPALASRRRLEARHGRRLHVRDRHDNPVFRMPYENDPMGRGGRRSVGSVLVLLLSAH